MPLPSSYTDFAGWQIVWQLGPGSLNAVEIDRLADLEDQPLCDTEHEVARNASYVLNGSSDAEVLCQQCLEDLYRNAANRPDYVMGVLPAD